MFLRVCAMNFLASLSREEVRARAISFQAFTATILSVLLLSLLPSLWSQTSQGTIGGAVQDQTGGAIADAMVMVTDVARGNIRTIVTDSSGTFVAPSLNP